MHFASFVQHKLISLKKKKNGLFPSMIQQPLLHRKSFLEKKMKEKSYVADVRYMTNAKYPFVIND